MIPPDHNAEFVAAMEDVLEVYHRPYDPDRPVVCFDETSPSNCSERPGSRSRRRPAVPPRRTTSTSATGRANLFMMFEPLAGRRHVKVTRAAHGGGLRPVRCGTWSTCITPRREKIVLVQDNLNTHKPASLYEAFPPEEARRLLDKLEFHYTPKHGSWLNMAETELSVLSRPVPRPPHPGPRTLTTEVARLGDPPQRAPTAPSTGSSPPPTPGSNSSDSTPSLNLSTLLWWTTRPAAGIRHPVAAT